MKTKICKNKKSMLLWLLFFTMLFIFARDVFFSRAQVVPLLDSENYQKTEKTIEVRMHKKDSTYMVQSLVVTTLSYPYLASYETLKGKAYNGGVISFRGKPLGYFTADEMVLTECWDGTDKNGNATGGCDNIPEGDILLRIPYFSNGNHADIYDLESKKILTIDLSAKATCNENGKCDRPTEDSINCPVDCKNGEPIISVSPAEQHINQSKTITSEVPWWKSSLILVGIAVIVIAILIFLFLKIRKNREENRW